MGTEIVSYVKGSTPGYNQPLTNYLSVESLQLGDSEKNSKQ